MVAPVPVGVATVVVSLATSGCNGPKMPGRFRTVETCLSTQNRCTVSNWVVVDSLFPSYVLLILSYTKTIPMLEPSPNKTKAKQ